MKGEELQNNQDYRLACRDFIMGLATLYVMFYHFIPDHIHSVTHAFINTFLGNKVSDNGFYTASAFLPGHRLL